MSSCEKNILKLEDTSSFTFEYKEWMTSAEAAKYLGISIKSLMNMTSQGKVPYYKFGRSNRYLRSELKALLMSQPRGVRNDN